MPNIHFDRTIIHFCNSYSMIFGRRTSARETDEQWKGGKCLSTMRQSFQALKTCRASLPPGKKYIAIEFLKKDVIFYGIDAKCKGQGIFEEACKHLGILDTELFGLALYQDGDYVFIDLNVDVCKYANRSFETHSNDFIADDQCLLVLHMRIKYYIESSHLICGEVRHQYYLQLRENVKKYFQPVSPEKSFILAALALQADLGSYDGQKHKNRYFNVNDYFPSWMIDKYGKDFIIRSIPALHKDYAGLSQREAQVEYIKHASDITAPHNLHFYKMQLKKGKTCSSVWLGIKSYGLCIYEQRDELDCTKFPLSMFDWRDIAKLQFEKNKFEILSKGRCNRKFTYFVQSEDFAKYLLWICRATHNFNLDYRSGNGYFDYFVSVRDNLNDVEHHSMEVLPIANGLKFPSDVKFKSQSISCFSDHFLAPNSTTVNSNSNEEIWSPVPVSNVFTTPSSTLMSRGSCASNTDSTCSTLSVTSSSTVKIGNSLTSEGFNDGSRWVKCDSFEELPLKDDLNEKMMHKVCISTFVDKHVRTASVYEAVTMPKSSSAKFSLNTTAELDTSAYKNSAYVTSSLGAASYKSSDVRRTPSLNVCRNSTGLNLNHKISSSSSDIPSPIHYVAQKHNRHYAASAQSHISSYSRTATRIGVSSLSRDQRLPLTLFGDLRILASGSAPNLYAPVSDQSSTSGLENCARSVKSQRLQNLGSRSEMSLNIIDQAIQNNGTNFNFKHLVTRHEHCDSKRQLSLPDICSDVLDGEIDFPCIPPPPAYRNEMEIASLSSDTLVQSPTSSLSSASLVPSPSSSVSSPTSILSDTVVQSKIKSQLPSNKATMKNTDPVGDYPLDSHRKLHAIYSSPAHVLDIHQLRQRSRDLDLPLISALFNDRSLLMLPKTVPTCSRQRHLGNKDPLRFNRTTSLPNGESTDVPFLNGGRSISWHLESGNSDYLSAITKPCSTSWDNGISTSMPQRNMVNIESAIQSHPPTILTSFGKTPVKPGRNVRDQSNSSDSYRYDTNQMIPTKLLAESLVHCPNGRLYRKGSSSEF